MNRNQQVMHEASISSADKNTRRREIWSAVLACAGIFAAGAALMRLSLRLPSLMGKNIYGYAGLLVFLALVMLRKRDSWQEMGFSLRAMSWQMWVFWVGFLPFLALSFTLSQANWRTWGGASLVGVISLGLTAVTAWWLRKKSMPACAGFMPAALLCLSVKQTILPALTDVIFFYGLVGLTEEALFRGFIQSGLDQAFGKPLRFFGIPWGAGLLVSALLFGLWHVLPNPLNPAVYPHALWTFCVGLFLGIVREKSAGIAAGTLLHGVLNYSPVAFVLALMGG